MQLAQHIKGDTMIIGKVFGSDKCNSHNFAIGDTGAHVRVMIMIRHGGINQDKRCCNPSDVHEHSFADVA
jgi:hypothetical protein